MSSAASPRAKSAGARRRPRRRSIGLRYSIPDAEFGSGDSARPEPIGDKTWRLADDAGARDAAAAAEFVERAGGEGLLHNGAYLSVKRVAASKASLADLLEQAAQASSVEDRERLALDAGANFMDYLTALGVARREDAPDLLPESEALAHSVRMRKLFVAGVAHSTADVFAGRGALVDRLEARLDRVYGRDQREAAADAPGEEVFVRAPVLVHDEAPVLRTDPERVYLAVPSIEHDQAEALGAQWDKAAQRWYAPSGSDLTAFEPWLPNPLELRPAERDHGRDPRQEFAEALREAGLELGGLPEMDGRLYRVRAAGDGRGERSGWYVGHADGHPAGSFGDWRTGDSRLWKSQRPVMALGAADRARLRAETAQRRRERERRADMQHEAAVDAIAAHLGMAVPAPADHPLYGAFFVKNSILAPLLS